MTPGERLVGGYLPTNAWWKVERLAVTEFHELGHRAANHLNGHSENRGDERLRTYTVTSRCYLAGHRADTADQLDLFGAAS